MLFKTFLLLTLLTLVQSDITITKDSLYLNIFPENDKLMLVIYDNNDDLFIGEIGIGLNVANLKDCVGIENCIEIDDVRLHVLDDIDHSFTMYWTTTDTSKILTDCYALNKTKINWFGGPERWVQDWPIEKLVLENFANIVQQKDFGSVTEPYWLNSAGYYIHVDKKTPLFINQNNFKDDYVCFIAKQEHPYHGRSRILLKYTIAKLDNSRTAHLHAINNFLGKPTGHPNLHIIKNPIWSTWARYKQDVSDAISLEYANEIVDHGFSNGQFELDDNWERCYGSLEFRSPDFENIKQTVQTIRDMGFTFSVWVHPFINTNCEDYTSIGLNNDYFVKNTEGSVLTKWWNSGDNEAQYLDFSNEEVRDWYIKRLKKMQSDIGIDSFKFDAGETDWTPQPPVFYGDIELTPNSITTDYVRTCAQLGDLIEVRSAYNTQDLPIFVRMMDKDSRWGHDNGLYTLITTLLQFNINGYTMVLPDMIGGNGYGETPDAELFIRWLQANTFMPSIQFSYVPWDYLNEIDIDVVAVSKKFVDIHRLFSQEIVRAMNNSIHLGYPVNGPVWWIDPTNADAHSIDTQFLLGEDIVVAPIIIQGATSRDVYLPTGTWIDANNDDIYEGPINILNYQAPLEVLPYFIRNNSHASELIKK